MESYYSNISSNILYELFLEVSDVTRAKLLGNSVNLNNSCCLSSVHLDYSKPITNYFSYFTNIIGSNKKLVELFTEAYRVDREIRMEKSRYTIMKFDSARAYVNDYKLLKYEFC